MSKVRSGPTVLLHTVCPAAPFLLLAFFLCSPAFAQNEISTQQFSDVLSKSGATVTKLFVLALLLESALAVLFNWRLFIVFFNGKGIKTPIAIFAAWLLASLFTVDPLMTLINDAGGSLSDSAASRWLTALILAGGSSGVNHVLTRLGYRMSNAEIEKADTPPQNKAWISVAVKRKDADGPILLKITPINPAPLPAKAAIAGVIDERPARSRLWQLFFRDDNRFPANRGGYTIDPDTPYDIVVEARNKDRSVIPNPLSDGPYVFATGAIVDFEVIV